MKKILLTILLTASPVFAFEDYMIISSEPVSSVVALNPEIVSVTTVFTIDNEKKNIIISPKQCGKTKINVVVKNSLKNIDVSVSENKTSVNTPLGFKSYSLDNPPAMPYLPKPPMKLFAPEAEKGGK